MTENEERLEELKGAVCRLVCIAEDVICGEDFEELDNAGAETIDCLEELRQYRAIGTVDGFRADKTIADKLYKFVKSDVDLLDKYLVIGTPEQCKVAVERMKPKKVLYREQNYGAPWLCPECEADQIKCEFFSEDGSEPQEKHTFCWKCGTVIDWGE